MPRALTRGASRPSKRKIKGPTSSKAKKAKKGRTSRSKKARVAHARTPAAFHEQAQTPAGAEHPSDAGLPFGGVGSTAGVSPRALVELTGISTASEAGLGGAILDLVGEGRLSVGHALAAWTHEQDRLANRAWRRPGGLQRMAGL
ncbi:MAG TPA: hypothetical protein VJR48_03275 [Ktedonobacterales bacterium]|nr:hypothetical protein [Ktedonobacterales bacterium]